MDFVRDLLVFVHLVGLSALLGGGLVQIMGRESRKVVNRAMVDGALIQVVSGLLLVGVIESQDDPLDNGMVGVMFAVGLLVAVLCWVNRRKPEVPAGLLYGIVGLTLANVAVGVFW